MRCRQRLTTEQVYAVLDALSPAERQALVAQFTEHRGMADVATCCKCGMNVRHVAAERMGWDYTNPTKPVCHQCK